MAWGDRTLAGGLVSGVACRSMCHATKHDVGWMPPLCTTLKSIYVYDQLLCVKVCMRVFAVTSEEQCWVWTDLCECVRCEVCVTHSLHTVLLRASRVSSLSPAGRAESDERSRSRFERFERRVAVFERVPSC